MNDYHITCSKRYNYHIILLGFSCTLSVDLIDGFKRGVEQLNYLGQLRYERR